MSKNCIIGDDLGGNNCAKCTFNFTCPDCHGLPSCARNGKICTEDQIRAIDSKFQDYTIDGDLQCKYSSYNADGDLICRAFN